MFNIKQLPAPALDILKKYHGYLVGGYIKVLLKQREFSKDIDILLSKENFVSFATELLTYSDPNLTITNNYFDGIKIIYKKENLTLDVWSDSVQEYINKVFKTKYNLDQEHYIYDYVNKYLWRFKYENN